jgi:hypothetical protein
MTYLYNLTFLIHYKTVNITDLDFSLYVKVLSTRIQFIIKI